MTQSPSDTEKTLVWDGVFANWDEACRPLSIDAYVIVENEHVVEYMSQSELHTAPATFTTTRHVLTHCDPFYCNSVLQYFGSIAGFVAEMSSRGYQEMFRTSHDVPLTYHNPLPGAPTQMVSIFFWRVAARDPTGSRS